MVGIIKRFGKTHIEIRRFAANQCCSSVNGGGVESKEVGSEEATADPYWMTKKDKAKELSAEVRDGMLLLGF
jgi:hypothetical protein